MTTKINLTDEIHALKHGLYGEQEYAENICDYEGHHYICDVISEIADGGVDIYTSDICQWFSNNWDLVDEAIAEFGHTDILSDIRMAQYMQIENKVYEVLDVAILLYALDCLTTNGLEEMEEEQYEELQEEVGHLDQNDKLSDIEEICDRYIEGDEE